MRSENHQHTARYWRSPLWSLLFLLPLLGSCAELKPINLLNATIPQVGYTLSEGIAYGDDSRQQLDIYSPTEPSPDQKLIVFVYGGAWRTGNRSEFEFVGQALSNAGHTVVIPDYRLFPNVTYPAFVDDVALAITALPELSALADIDPTSVVLMGHSSGAHSVAMLTTDSRFLENSEVSISALIGLSGPYDLPLDNPEVKPVFSGNQAIDVSPVLRASSGQPRTLLIHGLSDERVLPFHTRNFTQALEKVGVPVTMYLVDDGSHAGVLAGIAAPLQFTNDTLPVVLNFLAATND